MSYAVIKTGGKQFVVEKGSTIRIPSIDAEAGKSIELDALLTAGEGGRVDAGGWRGEGFGDGGRPWPRRQDRGVQEEAS